MSVLEQRRNRTRPAVAAVVGLGLVAGGPGLAADKQEDIHELMRVLGMGHTSDRVLAMVVQNVGSDLGERHPDISEDTLEASEKAVFRSLRWRSSELLNRIGRLYEERFSEAEIEELLAFYQTPTGQKLLEVMPDLMRLIYTASREWSQDLTPEIRDRLRSRLSKKGYSFEDQG